MANNALLKGLGAFGENFIKTLQYERENKRKNEEFNRKMMYEMRQMNLMNNIALDRNKIEREQSFVDVKEGDEYNQRGVDPGRYHTNLLDNLLGSQSAPKPKTYSKLLPLYGGQVEAQFQEGQEEPLSYGQFYKPDKDASSGSGGTTSNPANTFKEGELNQWQVRGLNYLQNPSFTNKEGEPKDVTSLETELDDNINNLGSGVLNGETAKWLSDIKAQYGRYPSPDELKKEILEDKDKLGEENGRRLYTFLNYYYKAYGGVKKIQQRIINPKSFDLE